VKLTTITLNSSKPQTLPTPKDVYGNFINFNLQTHVIQSLIAFNDQLMFKIIVFPDQTQPRTPKSSKSSHIACVAWRVFINARPFIKGNPKLGDKPSVAWRIGSCRQAIPSLENFTKYGCVPWRLWRPARRFLKNFQKHDIMQFKPELNIQFYI